MGNVISIQYDVIEEEATLDGEVKGGHSEMRVGVRSQ